MPSFCSGTRTSPREHDALGKTGTPHCCLCPDGQTLNSNEKGNNNDRDLRRANRPRSHATPRGRAADRPDRPGNFDVRRKSAFTSPAVAAALGRDRTRDLELGGQTRCRPRTANGEGEATDGGRGIRGLVNGCSPGILGPEAEGAHRCSTSHGCHLPRKSAISWPHFVVYSVRSMRNLDTNAHHRSATEARQPSEPVPFGRPVPPGASGRLEERHEGLSSQGQRLLRRADVRRDASFQSSTVLRVTKGNDFVAVHGAARFPALRNDGVPRSVSRVAVLERRRQMHP